MFELFKILGTVAVDNSEANQALGDTEQQAEKTSKSIGDRMQEGLGKAQKAVGDTGKKMSKWVTGPIVGVTTGMFGLVNSAANYADELVDLSYQTGMSAETLQELDYWANQNGISQSSLHRATGRLNQRIGRAAQGNDKYAEAFADLGVEIQNTDGSMRDTDEVFAETIYNLSQIEDSSTQSAMASEIFGTKLSRDLMPALSDGAMSMDDAAEAAREFSGFMSNEAVADADAFAQEIEDLKIEFMGLFREVAQDLIPIFRDTLFPLITGTIMPAIGDFIGRISELVDWFQGLDPAVQDNIVKFVALLAALGPILVVVGKVIGAIKLLIPVFTFLMNPVQAIRTVFTKMAPLLGTLGKAFAFLVSPIGLVITIVGALVAAFVYLWNTNEDFRNNIIGLWEGIKSFFMETVPEIVTGIIEWFSELPGRIGEFFSDIYNRATEWASDMWSKAKEAGSNFVESITSFFSELPGRIQTWLSNGINRVATWVSDMGTRAREAGSRFIDNVISFLQNLPSRVQTWLSNAISNVISWVSDMGSKGREAGRNLVDNALNTISNLGSRFISAGRNIVTSIADGITGAVSTVTDAIGGVVGKVRDFLPFSPAKEGPLMDINKLDFGGPISHSIEADENKVQRALRHLLEVPDVDRGVELPISGGKGTQETSQIKQLITNLMNKIDGLANRPIEIEVTVDGRVIAKVTRDHMDNELGNKRENKKRGR